MTANLEFAHRATYEMATAHRHGEKMFINVGTVPQQAIFLEAKIRSGSRLARQYLWTEFHSSVPPVAPLALVARPATWSLSSVTEGIPSVAVAMDDNALFANWA